jgi:hypothetical protein
MTKPLTTPSSFHTAAARKRRLIPRITQPIGLQAFNRGAALLTYAETGELLVDITNTADLLVDPRNVQAKLPPQ